jgi:peptidoglycan/LPS O-acetylase OafA/YrhL
MTEVRKEGYFLALTGVRALAAYMVYLHHLSASIQKSFGNQAFDIVKELHIGVTLFFVLSGFLIAYRYLDLKNFVFRTYMVNRFARIYPMYFILTTLTFVVFLLLKKDTSEYSFNIYLLNISFLKGFFQEYIFSGIDQGWTLTVEETFYLIAPVIFFLVKKRSFYLIVLPCSFILFGMLLVLAFKGSNFHGFFGSMEFMFNGTFFGRSCEFFTGIGLALVYKKNTFTFKYMTYLGLGVIIFSVFILSLIKTHWNLDSGNLHPLGMFVNTFFLPVFGVSLFYYGLITERTIVSKVLQTPMLVLLGKSSYIFYLIHMGLIALILHKFLSSEILVFITLNVLAVLLFKFVEEPMNLYLRAKFSKGQHKVKAKRFAGSKII